MSETNKLKAKAILGTTKIDPQGQVTLTFKVSKMFLKEALLISSLIEEVVILTVEPDPEKKSYGVK
jgi:hypothetical protein